GGHRPHLRPRLGHRDLLLLTTAPTYDDGPGASAPGPSWLVRVVGHAFFTTLDFSCSGPKPSTLPSRSWSPTPSTSRMPRTRVPTLMVPEAPLTLRSFTMVTVSPSVSTLPTASRTWAAT